MNEITHPTNASASLRRREIVTGNVIGIETGKGIETETVIGESLHVEDMELRRRGSGIGNVREMVPRSDHTRRKKKRKNSPSHCPPLSPGLWERCLSRQNLMVCVNLMFVIYHQR
jgi:hypothetical protein